MLLVANSYRKCISDFFCSFCVRSFNLEGKHSVAMSDNDVYEALTNADYKTVRDALEKSERLITNIYILPANTQLTYASLFGMGIGRRAVAMSSGFRSMVEQCNSLAALPMVRMQLDTAIRFYAGFWVEDHEQFCRDVFTGKAINKMKCDQGCLMQDKYLVRRLAERNSWMTKLYDTASGYVHFSRKHIVEAVRVKADGDGQMVIGPTDHDREPKDFLEIVQCMLHLNLILVFGLKDWFARMCNPDGVKVSAEVYWGGHCE
jgi:hypothetical protein